MTDVNDRLAALALAHTEHAVARLAAIIDAPWTTSHARIAAACTLLNLAAGRPAKPASIAGRVAGSAIQIDWAEPGAGAAAAAVGDTPDCKHQGLRGSP